MVCWAVSAGAMVPQEMQFRTVLTDFHGRDVLCVKLKVALQNHQSYRAALDSFEVVLFCEVRDNENGELRADSGKAGVLIMQK